MLQVVQIFAYLIMFEPKVMLIDEPDAHLHPDKQERLIEALERAAPEYDAQIILTTHSPHIVRAASPAAKLVWMRGGTVETEDDEAIRRLLGWGGLDKAALFFVEDEDDKPLRAVLRQWPDLARQVAVCRCFGIENLPRDKFLEGLLIDGKLKISALLHRDGDFMNAEEGGRWRQGFKTPGVFPGSRPDRISKPISAKPTTCARSTAWSPRKRKNGGRRQPKRSTRHATLSSPSGRTWCASCGRMADRLTRKRCGRKRAASRRPR